MKSNYLIKKKRFIGKVMFALILTVFSTVNVKAQTYCNSNFGSVCCEWVDGVIFSNINNTGTGGQTGGPINYTTQVANVLMGSTYVLTVQAKVDGNNSVVAWIDWNNNGTLNDAGEVYTLVSNTGLGGPTPHTFTINVAVPGTAVTGINTRMRVMCIYANANPTPCQSATYGESEDYSVFVIPPIPCSAQPSVSAVTPAVTPSICPNSPVSMGLSGQNTYSFTAITYQWYESSTGAPGSFTPSSAPSATTPIYNVNPTVTTWYMAEVTCTNLPTPLTATCTPQSVFVYSVPINTVPYLETFEGLQANNTLPNCGWAVDGNWLNSGTYNTGVFTFTSNNTYYGNGQQNHTPSGSKYASFLDYWNYDTKVYYTNQFTLTAGVTYSAAVWYISDGYYPKNLAINLCTSQTAASQTMIVENNAVSNTTYQKMGGTFTVPADGLYYISVSNTDNGNMYYTLSFDDLEVTIPCSLNSVDVNIDAPSSVCFGSQATLTAVSGSIAVLAPTSYTWNTGAQTSSITAQMNTPTSFTVNVENIAGCANTKTINIGVIPLPAVSIFAPENSLCEQSTTHLPLVALGTASSYTWIPGGSNAQGISVNPSATTIYTVLGSDFSGCVNSANQQVIVNPLPDISILSSEPVKSCKGDKVELTAVGATTYTWTSQMNYIVGQQVSVFPTETITYTIMGADQNGCVGKTTYEQKVDECLGLNQLKDKNLELSVYPNPANGEFMVELNNGAVKILELSDLTGRIVLSNTTSDDKATVNISQLANGVYYLKVQSNGASKVMKVVKQ